MKVQIYRFIFILLIFLSFSLGNCHNSSQTMRSDFEEMKDPTVDTLSDWSHVESGLNISFVSIDKKYSKSVFPDIQINSVEHLVGWKGERVAAQILMWTKEEIKNVKVSFTDFTSHNSKLNAAIANARFVRYVMTDIYGPGCGHRKPENFPASLSADMLDDLDVFTISQKTVRPVWITIQIPQDAPEGLYRGELKVQSKNNTTQSLTIQLEVQNQTLPPYSEWKYHLDLWQHPSAIARYENLEVWSDEHFKAIKPVMQPLVEAGQKVITATLNKEPWNNQTYDAFADMIIWNKNVDNSWTYDYTIFDRWVQFMMDMGVNKMINCYSMLPWNNELHYYDKATESFIDVKADPGTEIFYDIWTPFLLDFVKHLKEKEWLEITNIAMDERSPEHMEYTLKLLQEVVPELGISLADNHKSYKRYPYIKDMCVQIDQPVDSTDLANRKQNNLNTTYYVCCSSEFPNVFTMSESGEATYMAWYAVANEFDGMLRWAYNSWVENPLTDSRFRTWPAGDTYIVYPGGRSSIRFERLVEGIQDAEKIRILREKFINENTLESLKKLNELNEAVKLQKIPYRYEGWQENLNQSKEVINRLSR